MSEALTEDGSPADSPAAEALVYIVDDDEQLCSSVAWLLESVNFRARCFTDPAAFLAGLDPHRPACLILDVRMPKVGGFQIQEHLNASGALIPIIFVSAHGDIRMSVRALQEGAVDFLEKPYDPQHMLEVVQRAWRTAQERFALYRRSQGMWRRLAALTPREREILRLAVRGTPGKAIADQLGISVKTVDVHRARLREKTAAPTVAALVTEVLSSGIPLDDL